MPEVFSDMRNYVEGHTFTDIGRRLLDAYNAHFLAYEHAHQEVRPFAALPPFFAHFIPPDEDAINKSLHFDFNFSVCNEMAHTRDPLTSLATTVETHSNHACTTP